MGERKNQKKNKVLTAVLIALIIIILLLAALFWLSTKRSGDSPLDSKEGIISENGTISLCFSFSENCTSELKRAISEAESIRAALYDLDEKSLLELLASKEADVLIDEDNHAGFGKKISGTGLMHNKFWLLYCANSSNILITGSTNPTRNDLNKNDNNMIIIDSPTLFRNYLDEFLEIKEGRPDGRTKRTKIIFNGVLIENYFCPDDGCEEKVITALQGAKESIYFMTFSFTSDPIGDFLIKEKNNLDIRGVFDESQVKSQMQYTEYNKMISAGMNVRIDGNSAKLHHKVFIVDNSTVITGSYNPTSAGTSKNDENILIIHDKTIASEFINEFERVWSIGKTW